MLINVYEKPQDSSDWIADCAEDCVVKLPTLFQTIVEKHFSHYALEDFCTKEMIVSKVHMFEDELLDHVNELDMDHVKEIYRKLEYWWNCLEMEKIPQQSPLKNIFRND